jgi:hypothetical protein
VLHVFVEKSHREFFTHTKSNVMYRRFASIPRFCRMRSAQIFRWPDQDAANRR